MTTVTELDGRINVAGSPPLMVSKTPRSSQTTTYPAALTSGTGPFTINCAIETDAVLDGAVYVSCTLTYRVEVAVAVTSQFATIFALTAPTGTSPLVTSLTAYNGDTAAVGLSIPPVGTWLSFNQRPFHAALNVMNTTVGQAVATFKATDYPLMAALVDTATQAKDACPARPNELVYPFDARAMLASNANAALDVAYPDPVPPNGAFPQMYFSDAYGNQVSNTQACGNMVALTPYTANASQSYEPLYASATTLVGTTTGVAPQYVQVNGANPYFYVSVKTFEPLMTTPFNSRGAAHAHRAALAHVSNLLFYIEFKGSGDDVLALGSASGMHVGYPAITGETTVGPSNIAPYPTQAADTNYGGPAPFGLSVAVPAGGVGYIASSPLLTASPVQPYSSFVNAQMFFNGTAVAELTPPVMFSTVNAVTLQNVGNLSLVVRTLGTVPGLPLPAISYTPWLDTQTVVGPVVSSPMQPSRSITSPITQDVTVLLDPVSKVPDFLALWFEPSEGYNYQPSPLPTTPTFSTSTGWRFSKPQRWMFCVRKLLLSLENAQWGKDVSQHDLFDMSVRNGVNTTWARFVGLIPGVERRHSPDTAGALNTPAAAFDALWSGGQLPTVGAPILLRMGRDVPLQPTSSGGVAKQMRIQVTATVYQTHAAGPNGAGVTPRLMAMYLTRTQLACALGLTRILDSVVTPAQVAASAPNTQLSAPLFRDTPLGDGPAFQLESLQTGVAQAMALPGGGGGSGLLAGATPGGSGGPTAGTPPTSLA
jgi:hypothetical protein